MRRTVSLFDFMPYGAPELIAARRPHLAAALTSASALAATMFIAALVLSPLIRMPSAPIQHGIIVIDPPPPSALPNIAPPPPPITPTRSHAGSDASIVIPVPPSEAPMVESFSGPGTSTAPSTGALVAGESDAGSQGSSSEVLPEFGVYVHVDELPVAITEFKPEYPELARQVGAEGYVVVQALVGKDGHVLSVRLDDKLRDPLFNEASLDGAKHWVFKPAYSDGHPVAVWVPIPFRFVLRE